MNNLIEDLRNQCSNLLDLTESGDFNNVNFDDVKQLISNPYMINKMRLSGYYLVYISPNLLKKPTEYNHLDSYFGTVSYYEWHKNSIAGGAEFSSINHLLNDMKKTHPHEKNILDTIYRKTAYLNVLKSEIIYLSTRYIWAEKSEFKEIFLAKFENFTTSLVELIITCINLYERIVLKRLEEVTRFGKILDFLTNPDNKLPSEYQWSINKSINLSFYIYIRNSLVHNFSEIEYLDNDQNPILNISNIPDKKRGGLFKNYMKEEFNKYDGKKTQQTYQKYRDERFPYISFEFYISKKSHLDSEKSKIGFEMNIIDLTKKMLGDFFILQEDLFKTIKDMA